MKTLEVALKGLAAVFGSIPGLAILITHLGAPPDKSKLFGAITEVFGVLTFALIINIRKEIQRRRSPGVLACCLMIIAAFASMLLYIYLLGHCVIFAQDPAFATQPPVYFPIWTTGDVATAIDKEGSRTAVVDKYGPASMEKQIAKMSRAEFLLLATTTILIVILQFTVSLITSAFAILGIRVAQGRPK